jgi:predicted O-methyltransferase YrrM
VKHKLLFKRFVERIVNLVVKSGKDALALHYVSDEVILATLQANGGLTEIHDPLAYVNFLLECIQPLTFSIRELKGKEDLDSVESKRFATFLFSLQSGLPPVDFSLAKEIGLIADRYRSLYSPLEYHQWAGDTALHFSVASSFGKKGRLLFNIVRLLRSRDCLELGTAYGLSALFLCGGMRAIGVKGHLTTIELAEHQFSLASTLLQSKYADSVTCIHGSTQDQLAKVVKTLSGLDFVFHDAGHTREDYITDFNAFVEGLRRGAVVLFDDIYWDDRRWYTAPTCAHEGWLEVVSHPRVKRAVEINEEMGLLLIN